MNSKLWDCPRCKGSGRHEKYGSMPCPKCHGAGMTKNQAAVLSDEAFEKFRKGQLKNLYPQWAVDRINVLVTTAGEIEEDEEEEEWN